MRVGPIQSIAVGPTGAIIPIEECLCRCWIDLGSRMVLSGAGRSIDNGHDRPGKRSFIGLL